MSRMIKEMVFQDCPIRNVLARISAQFKQKQRKVKMREMNCKWLRMSNIS